MAMLDVDRLLEPVSDDSPCGPNLEYDDTYAAFERAARGKAEQQYGETIIPAEPPDWLEVRRLGVELVERTKDLRVACQLARGLLETEGLTDFAASLALIRGYIERYWPTVHPQLDPDDDNDPTLRVNTVASLSNQATTIRSLRAAPIVSFRGLGRFSLRDLGVATGDVPPGPNEEPPKLATIEAAFTECPLDELKANTDAVCQCLEHVEAIDSILTQQVGATRAVGLDDLRTTILELRQVLTTNLARRDSSAVVEGADGETTDQTAATPGQPAARATGEIRSREDVVAALDRICQYYNRYEPSSPLPLLLNRAKRLASKSFLEIVKDLTPDAVSQIQILSGVSEDGDAD
jgi:type VI secretion system protein ImpA